MCTPVLAIQIIQIVSIVVEAIAKSGIIQEIIDYLKSQKKIEQ